jgi:hypothetical protein
MATVDEEQQARIEERRRTIASREPKEGTYNSRVKWGLGPGNGVGVSRGRVRL